MTHEDYLKRHKQRDAELKAQGHTMRFLNQFRVGDGDYTVEREALFKNDSVKSIVAGIKAQRKRNV